MFFIARATFHRAEFCVGFQQRGIYGKPGLHPLGGGGDDELQAAARVAGDEDPRHAGGSVLIAQHTAIFGTEFATEHLGKVRALMLAGREEKQPPGSLPGIRSLAMAPTMRPIRMAEMMPIKIGVD